LPDNHGTLLWETDDLALFTLAEIEPSRAAARDTFPHVISTLAASRN
jgi:hypothetical protein